MKTLLSLFDYSGKWSQPFADNGWNTIRWDIKIDEFMDINLIEDCEIALDQFPEVDGILAAIPCTDFAASGAHTWKKKDMNGDTYRSIEIAKQVMRLVNLYYPTDPEFDGTFFYAIENPVGRLGKLLDLGPAKLWFNPCDYAGYLNPSSEQLAKLDRIRQKDGIGVTKQEADFILKMEAYTKKTGLWGEFNHRLIEKPIQPAKAAPAGSPIMRSGGKKASTKEYRSNTPSGFAQAFYEANKDYCCFADNSPLFT